MWQLSAQELSWLENRFSTRGWVSTLAYHTCAIISHGLYIFYSIFKTISLFSKRFLRWILTLCMVSIQERVMKVLQNRKNFPHPQVRTRVNSGIGQIIVTFVSHQIGTRNIRISIATWPFYLGLLQSFIIHFFWCQMSMSGKEQSYNLDLESIQNLNFRLDIFKARYVQLKYGFCNKVISERWNSDQLNTFTTYLYSLLGEVAKYNFFPKWLCYKIHTLIPVWKKMGLNSISHLLPKQQQNVSICVLQKINKIQRIFQMKISFNNSFFGSLNKL